ncbi:hypothetical protein B0H14DRAFT_2648777 [Mycena olivaceomarginata]|nr:hypothetical protein B0H14DRAFT_2648777 [Mycena olivaceomarginata]
MVTGEFEESTIPLLWAQFPWREVRHHADQSHSARWEADKAFGFTVQPLPALPLIMTTIQDIRQQLQNIGASTPERLSLASFPWLHREIESCTLDPEKSAANVAAAIEMQGNTKIVDKLLHYFKSIKDFDVKACRGRLCGFRSGANTKPRWLSTCSGCKSQKTPRQSLANLRRHGRVNKATAMGVADLIRWVVNLDEVAPMVLPLPLAKIVKVARDSELMEDWVLALRNTRDDLTHRLVYEEPDPTSTTHVKQSRGVVLLKSAKSQSKNAARCNLELFVYALQAQLMGDPWMKRETVEELVRTSPRVEPPYHSQTRSPKGFEENSASAALCSAESPQTRGQTGSFGNRWLCGGQPAANPKKASSTVAQTAGRGMPLEMGTRGRGGGGGLSEEDDAMDGGWEGWGGGGGGGWSDEDDVMGGSGSRTSYRYLDASSTWMDDIWDLEISADKNEEPVSVPDEVKDEEPLHRCQSCPSCQSQPTTESPSCQSRTTTKSPSWLTTVTRMRRLVVQDTEQQEDEDDEDDDEDEEEGVVAWLNVHQISSSAVARLTLEIEHWEVQAHEDGKLHFLSSETSLPAVPGDLAACATYVTDSNPKGMVPLHVHPDAQKYPFGPDAVPGPGVSGIYVVHEANWKKMTAGEIPRSVSGSLCPRYLGRKKSRSDDTLSAGKPVDLIYCREQREAREEVGDMAEGQAFNILSNRTPGLTAKPPPKWRHRFIPADLDPSTRPFYIIFTKDPELPAYQFPWEEFNWVILANRDAMTWCHNDVLFTLWFIARRKSNLAPGDFRGNMRSRQAFKGFNGNTDMTQVFDWEMLTLTPYTTLYMAAATVHAESPQMRTTSRSPSPPADVHRHLLVSDTSWWDEDKEPIPKRYLDHLPNLYTPAGDSYPYIFRDGKDKLLPINPDVWAEVQYAWELAMQLENMVHTGWDIVITKPCPGIEHLDFHRIADSVAVHTAVSLVKYHAETARALGKERPDGFTTGAFKYQLRQMLGRFDLHRRSSWHKSYGYPKATHSRNGPTNEKAFSEIRVVDSFDKACNDDSKAHIMLFPWEEGNVPFKLVQKTGS